MKIYVIFRKHRKNSKAGKREIFYGWTTNKNVLKAFLQQRDNNKYTVIEDEGDPNEMSLDGHPLERVEMIDCLSLKSVNTGEDVILFLTCEEKQEAEIRIQKYFRNLSSLANLKGDLETYLNMYTNLDQYYYDALDLIGFIPPELSALYPTDEFDISDMYEGIEDQISAAYHNHYGDPYNRGLPGSLCVSAHKKILYSLESFIKVLAEDL